MSLRHLAISSAYLLLALSARPAAADPSGVVDYCKPTGGSGNNYLIIIAAGTCPNQIRHRWVPENEPPLPAQLECEGVGPGLDLCTAWPQGETLRYSWVASGAIRVDGIVSSEATPRGDESGALIACKDPGLGQLTVQIGSTQGSGEKTELTYGFYCPDSIGIEPIDH